jgi:glycosyltransferase involved in cell wall biosynthesis
LAALAQTPGLSALLVGDGDLRSQYELRSRGLGLGDRVRFIGRISDQDLPDVYRAADFLVLPSETRGEAFGVVLLEAMASGKPVIASNLPGVRSVVADGIDGLLVRPSDSVALAEALDRMARMSGEARAAMGRAGRRKVEASYEWNQIGDRLEAIYCDVVNHVKAGIR